MGKRSDFERKGRDFYPTPYQAVARADEMIPVRDFAEPCAGNGELMSHLYGGLGRTCVAAIDIHPLSDKVSHGSATDLMAMSDIRDKTDLIITNPPWKFGILSEMLDVWLAFEFEVWVLLSGDFMHNVQSSPYMKQCSDVVPVGRLKWEPKSKHTGKDNCAWYRFVPHLTVTQFHPRDRS